MNPVDVGSVDSTPLFYPQGESDERTSSYANGNLAGSFRAAQVRVLKASLLVEEGWWENAVPLYDALRHHSDSVLQGLPLVAEPDPYHLSVVSETVR